MPVGGAAIAGVLVLGGLGFGGGYVVASMGGDDGGGETPPAKSGDPVLPAVTPAVSKPKIVVLGSAPALPAPKRRAQSRNSPERDSGPSSTPTPRATAAPTSAPTSAPTAAPPQPTAPPPDDIIEG